MEVNLNGKVALVTGVGPNIGSGLALMLGKYGAKVACNDVRPEVAQATVERLERNGVEAMSIPGDVSNEEEVKAYVQRVVDEWGRIDILINCAGIDGGASVLEFEAERWTRQISVNLSGNFFNTKWVGRHMVEKGIKGSIICIISTAGWQGRANSVGYCSSKGGIIQFVRAAAMDLAPYGIRINSFTPPQRRWTIPRSSRRARRRACAGRWAFPRSPASPPARTRAASRTRRSAPAERRTSWRCRPWASCRRRPTTATWWRGCAPTTRAS